MARKEGRGLGSTSGASWLQSPTTWRDTPTLWHKEEVTYISPLRVSWMLEFAICLKLQHVNIQFLSSEDVYFNKLNTSPSRPSFIRTKSVLSGVRFICHLFSFVLRAQNVTKHKNFGEKTGKPLIYSSLLHASNCFHLAIFHSPISPQNVFGLVCLFRVIIETKCCSMALSTASMLLSL